MYVIIKKYIREDVNTPFFFEISTPSEKYSLHIRSTYGLTKKLLGIERTMSEDLTNFTVKMIFNTRDDYLDFVLDPIPFHEYGHKNHIYNLKNNIKTESSLE
jgi:hypothetical protein